MTWRSRLWFARTCTIGVCQCASGRSACWDPDSRSNSCCRHATDTQQFLFDGNDDTRAHVFAELNLVSAQHKTAFKNVFSKDGQAADVTAQVAPVLCGVPVCKCVMCDV